MAETQSKVIELSTKLDTTLGVNNSLKEHVDKLLALNKDLQQSMHHRAGQQNQQNQSRHVEVEDRSEDGEIDDDDENDEARDEVVLLHDSMCREINDTLLSREKIRVKKVFAPDLEKMEDALDNVNAKVVVLQALTRDLSTIEAEKM